MGTRINTQVQTVVAEALIEVAEVSIPADVNRLNISLALSDDTDFDQCEVRGNVGDAEVTFASASGDFTSPAFPLLGASGDLTGLAADTSGWLMMDVEGIARIRVLAACAAAEDATGVLTAAANATGGVDGTGILTASANAVGGAASAGVLTGTTIDVGDTVTIGSIVYTFVASIELPPTPYQVLVGASDSDSLDNLIAAINGDEGIGRLYSWNTVSHPDVIAAAGGGDTIDVDALVRGTAGDTIATTDTLTAGGFGAATLENGANSDTVTLGDTTYIFDAAPLIDEANHVLVGAAATDSLDNLIAAVNLDAGEGSLFGSGTVANAQVSAAAGAGDTIDFTTLTRNGDTIDTTEVSAVLSFGDPTMQDGVTGGTITVGDITYIFDDTTLVDIPNHVLVGVAATNTLDNLIAAIENGVGEGSTYGTGTVANPDADAAAGTGDTIDLTADVAGKAANSVETTETDPNFSFAAATLVGGKGPTTVSVALHS